MEVIETRKQGARLRLPDTDPARAAEVLKGMVKDGVPVIEFHREERNLEDAFIDILGQLEQGGAGLTAPPDLSTPDAPSAKDPSISEATPPGP